MVSIYTDRKILVTGGCGMIGSHIVDELLKCNARVRITQHIRPSPFGANVDVVSAYLRTMSACRKAVEGIDYVFHAAGVTGGLQRAKFDPIPTFTDNLIINTQVLEA